MSFSLTQKYLHQRRMNVGTVSIAGSPVERAAGLSLVKIFYDLNRFQAGFFL